MPVKTKKTKTPSNPALANAIAAGVAQLHREHESEIMEYLKDSEEKSLTVNYAVEIDCSESQPVVQIKQRFSQSVTDRRVARLENDDPNQTSFQFVKPEDLDQKQLGLDDGEKADGDDGDGDGAEGDKS